jgi:cytochrome P450
MWMVTRYEDVRTVLHDWETFASGEGCVWPRRPELVRQIPIDIDPPAQQEYRKALQPYFTIESAERHRSGALRMTTEMLDQFIECGHCDIAKEFTRVYPARFFVEEVLGADGAMVDQLMEWGHAVARHQGNEIGQRAFDEMGAWIEGLFASSADDTGVVAGIRSLRRPDGRPLSLQETVLTLHTIIVGGLDTTANVLGNIIRNFATMPRLVEQLNADRTLLPAALEELIRYEPPLHGLFRTVTKPVEIGGAQLQAGDHVLVSYASANRDEVQFSDPDTIDFHRTSNRHVGFGLGPHRCVGIHLARVEMLVALEQILDRMRDIRLDGEIENQEVYVRGPISMPISFTPGPRISKAS